jgi:hypothetical protein
MEEIVNIIFVLLIPRVGLALLQTCRDARADSVSPKTASRLLA